MLNKINFLFVTLFGIGKIKKIPGSFASLATILFLFFLFHIANVSANIVLTNKDPKEIVIDEFIGQSIPICLYEIAHDMPKDTDQVLKFYFIMFILFRIFDIVKPFPVNYYEKNFKNSFGVIMDDVCAGLYVVAVLVLYMVVT